MCFTIHIRTSRDAIEKRFKVDSSALHNFEFKYFYRAFDNPLLPVITQSEPERIKLMSWGLMPNWARDQEHAESIRKGTYNARGESLSEKPSFKSAYETGRCWIIAKGFFEWQHIGKERIPWFIQREDEKPFVIAGIYDTWRNPETGSDNSTFSLVTTRANPLMERIHNTKRRMPLILEESIEHSWIDPVLPETQVQKILQPLDEKLLSAHTISKKISSSTADPFSPDLIKKQDYYIGKNLFSDDDH